MKNFNETKIFRVDGRQKCASDSPFVSRSDVLILEIFTISEIYCVHDDDPKIVDGPKTVDDPLAAEFFWPPCRNDKLLPTTSHCEMAVQLTTAFDVAPTPGHDGPLRRR